MTGRLILRVTIVAAAAYLGFEVVQRADAEYVGLPRGTLTNANQAYSRVMHGLPWIGVAAMLGAAGLFATDPRTRRRPWSPGAITVAATMFTAIVVIVFYVLTCPPIFRATGDFITLGDQLDAMVPGAVIGAWAALLLGPRRIRRDPMEFTGLLVGGLWILSAVLLILYGFIFG